MITSPHAMAPSTVNRLHRNIYAYLACFIFSCEDAALQVLMLVCVCPCVRGQPENLPSYIFLKHTECSRMFQNVPECSRMFQNVPECMQNVPEYSRMHAE